MHDQNLRKMDPCRTKMEKDIADEDGMGRNYSILEATTAKVALDNCSKLSSLISTVEPEKAKKIEDSVDLAIDTLAIADSLSKLDSWHREQLSPPVDSGRKSGKGCFAGQWTNQLS